jgi:hypothetical protein
VFFPRPGSPLCVICCDEIQREVGAALDERAVENPSSEAITDHAGADRRASLGPSVMEVIQEGYVRRRNLFKQTTY